MKFKLYALLLSVGLFMVGGIQAAETVTTSTAASVFANVDGENVVRLGDRVTTKTGRLIIVAHFTKNLRYESAKKELAFKTGCLNDLNSWKDQTGSGYKQLHQQVSAEYEALKQKTKEYEEQIAGLCREAVQNAKTPGYESYNQEFIEVFTPELPWLALLQPTSLPTATTATAVSTLMPSSSVSSPAQKNSKWRIVRNAVVIGGAALGGIAAYHNRKKLYEKVAPLVTTALTKVQGDCNVS